MSNYNADIELEALAKLNTNSSEEEIKKGIRILENRLRNSSDGKIHLSADLDQSSLNQLIKKLQTLLKNKKLGLSTKESIVEIQKEAKSMLEVVSAASKASKEKLKFADANKKVKDSARNTSNVINQERSAMGRLNDINYIMQNINARANTGNSIFQQFGVTLRDAFYYYSAANLLQRSIYKVIDAGKESIETVKELNDAAVSLQMATGKNYEYISQLMKSYNELGQEIGATTKSVAESADAWLRQGHTIEDTNTLINDSMILSKIANMDSADSTKYLTSAMQGYKVAVGDVIGIVDKLSAVDLVSANSADGLAEAISRTAEGAQIAGVSMDRLLAMVATVGEVTQKSMSSIGESYKTIFSRMRDIKDNKLSVIGEDGEIEDLSNVEIVLNSLGIKLRESNQEFRNFQDVLDEVANEWNNYSTVQQAAIGKAFSGVRQQENFLVMMENYDKVKKYTEVAANSSGTSEEKFDYYLDSLEAKTESLKASLEGLATTTISKELYSSVLDVTKGFVDAATESGVLKATLAGLATSGAIYAISQLTTYLGSAAQGFANLSEAMLMTRGNVAINDMQRLADLTVGLSASQTRLVLTTNTLTDAQKIAILMNQGLTEQEARLQIATWGVAAAEQGATAATITMGSVMSGVFATISAHPFVAITLAIGTGVVAINKYLSSLEERQKKLKEKAEEAKTAINDLSSTYESHKKTIEECANSYERLSKGVNTFTNENFNLSDEEYQTYLNTVNSISEVFPQLRTGIDENGNAIIQFSDKTKSATENLYDFLEAEKYTANYKIAQELPDLFGGVQIYNKELTSLKDKYDSVNESAAGCLDVVKGMTDLSNPLKDEYEFTIDNTTEIGVNTFNVLSKAVQNYIDIMHEAGRHDINDWLNWEHIFGDIDNLGRTKIHLNLPDAYFTPEDKVAFQTLVQTALSDLMPDLTDEIGEYQQELKTKTSEFEASWIDFRANLVNAMHSKASYQGFDDVSKNIADQLVGNLSSDIASKMDDDDPYKYIQDNIISALIIPPNETAEQKKVRESFINKMNQLLTFDGNESELNSFVEAFQLWLDQNGFNIDITPIANIKQDSIEQETQKAIEDTNKKILSFSEAWKNLSVDGDLSTKLLKLASDGELTGFKIEELAEKEELLKQAMDDTGLSAEKFAEKLRELNIDNIKSDIVTFTDSLNKLKNGQILSLEETTKLITADNKLAGAVKKVGDGYVIEKDAIKDVINSHKEKYNIAISYEVQQTQTTIQNTKARITEMKTEMSALKELVEAYQMAISARNKLSGTTSGSYSDELALIEAQKQQESVDKELSKKNKKLKKAEKKLQQLLAGLKNTESKGKSDSSSQKSSQQFDFIQIKLERLQNQYQKYISKAENGTLSLTKRTNNYSKALSNLTKQINTQDKAYTKYMNKANKVKLSDSLKKKIREGSID